MDEIIWGTLIALDGGQPYAIETSFAVDGNFLYTGSKRGGRMNRCIEQNPVATFKICDSTRDAKLFRAAIVESEEVGDYFADILVEDKIILELKSTEQLSESHETQLLNYLKATEMEVGMLMNFGEN